MKRKNINKCRWLRKNQTDAEAKLWSVLRNRRFEGIKFRRQFPVGDYIVDFYCAQYRLAIEVDGGQHYEEEGRVYDEKRTEELKNFGVEILRFNNLEVLKNIEGVCEVIRNKLKELRNPSPQSSPQRVEEE